jgi:hypothetical protein
MTATPASLSRMARQRAQVQREAAGRAITETLDRLKTQIPAQPPAKTTRKSRK